MKGVLYDQYDSTAGFSKSRSYCVEVEGRKIHVKWSQTVCTTDPPVKENCSISDCDGSCLRKQELPQKASEEVQKFIASKT
jgi:hypothetical protein